MPTGLVLVLGFWIASAFLDLASAGYRHRRDRARRTLWRSAAGEAGLQSIEEVGNAVRSYSGQLLVRFGKRSEEEPNGPTEVEIAGPGLAPRFAVGPQGATGVRDIELGDEDFDREVRVEGAPAVSLAILDESTREAVRTLLRGSFVVDAHGPLPVTGRIDPGLLRIWVPWEIERDGRLAAVVRAGLALAARLVAPSEVANRLASNLALERNTGVRCRILRTLVRDFPEHQATQESLRAMRHHPDAELRVQAGIALGAEGRDVLLEAAAGKKAGDKAGARAVAALRQSLTLEEATELFRQACQQVRVQTARACLGIIGTHGREAIPLLSEALLAPELGDLAARALGSTDDPSVEAPLLRALVEGPRSVRPEAAQALGRVGTRDAVRVLREAEADVELRPVARQAIARIQSRLAGAGQGQLSLAGDQGGRLSIADDESGRLSLTGEPGTPSTARRA